MAIKEAVFVMVFVMLLVATDGKQPDESGGLGENLFLTSVYDGSDGNVLGDEVKETINEITKLVKKKKFKRNRKEVLRLLKELSAMTEDCAAPPPPPPKPECEAGWVRHGESCYYIDDTPTQAWSTARAACQSRGADLPIIKSEDENEFIGDLVFAQDTVTWGGAWIGIERHQADNKLYWIDDTLVAGGFTGWEAGNPSDKGGREDCGHIMGQVGPGFEHQNRKWNDLHCNLVEHNFINNYPVILCEKSI